MEPPGAGRGCVAGPQRPGGGLLPTAADAVTRSAEFPLCHVEIVVSCDDSRRAYFFCHGRERQVFRARRTEAGRHNPKGCQMVAGDRCAAPTSRTARQNEVGTPRCGVPARDQRAEPAVETMFWARVLSHTLFRARRARGRRSAPFLPPVSTARCGACEISGLESLNHQTHCRQVKFRIRVLTVQGFSERGAGGGRQGRAGLLHVIVERSEGRLARVTSEIRSTSAKTATVGKATPRVIAPEGR